MHHEGGSIQLTARSSELPGVLPPWVPIRALPWTRWKADETSHIPSWLEHRHDISHTHHVKQTLTKKNMRPGKESEKHAGEFLKPGDKLTFHWGCYRG